MSWKNGPNDLQRGHDIRGAYKDSLQRVGVVMEPLLANKVLVDDERGCVNSTEDLVIDYHS